MNFAQYDPCQVCHKPLEALAKFHEQKINLKPFTLGATIGRGAKDISNSLGL